MSIFDVLFGRPLESKEEHSQKVGVLAGLPMLGLDGLGSAAYGPEAALTILIPLGVAGIGYSLPIIGIIVAILTILYFSYRQTIAAYPNGGGSYTVARANLGATAGLIAAAALMLDYVLCVAVGISAGVGALVSAIPSFHAHILPICLGILVLVTVVNLRGVKESGIAFALPTYLFVASLGGVLLVAFGGITDRLIPLFAVGAFLAFTLSQAVMVKHWLRHRHGRWKSSALVNGIGAVSTLVALSVVLVAKFADGAHITCILLPTFVVAFVAVKRHYLSVRRETRVKGNLDARSIRPPLVIVPIKNLNCVSEKALRFAASISPDFEAIHIANTQDHCDSLTHQWQDRVAVPFRQAGHPMPVLHVLSSPYRRLFNPLIGYLRDVLRENPDRVVAVIIPELVEARWWQYFLHNQRAMGLKAAMLLQGGSRLVVINVPCYLESETRP